MLNIGKYIIRLDSVDSTNNYAAALISKDKPAEGTVIMAEYQEYGRGHQETAWESDRGLNLLVSIILYPELDVSDFFLFNQCITLAAHEMIEQSADQHAEIKWPNDILVKKKKIAGILIENVIRGNNFQHSVAGVGININQEKFRDYELPATSLSLLKRKKFQIHDLLHQLCFCLNKWYGCLAGGNYDLISSAYSKNLFQKDIAAVYESKGVKFNGIIRSVNEDGKLWIEKETGELVKFGFKEIKFLNE